ncbi:GtrA family protein [Neobacillus sp. 19]|uniref:GtrA family protein n=1 Tax=Neobacillus sp. 19 TaxID=3394458 RepID=UPI003BF6BD40
MNRFLKFAVVGIGNTIISIASFALLEKLWINYIAANIIAYGLGMINSFIWNKKWVFRTDLDVGQLSLLCKFTIVNLITLGCNTMFLYLLVGKLNFISSLAQVFSTVFGILINYGLNKKWTFRVPDPIVK